MSLKMNLFLADEHDKQYVRPQSFNEVRLYNEFISLRWQTFAQYVMT